MTDRFLSSKIGAESGLKEPTVQENRELTNILSETTVGNNQVLAVRFYGCCLTQSSVKFRL
ncbi:hypothetical protein [Allocoleopsis franciscana]|uniref:hypothetical protein n=1 Tax=Allocoleopsis franciscana TaxID=2886352 RepID=UPI0002DB98E4|nr:hypothetical protein [Allocoleopsis franciscana]